MSLADTLVARALECDGLSFGNKATRRGYLLHCYPGDINPAVAPEEAARLRYPPPSAGEPNAQAHQMGAVQSSCLLHVRGVLAEDECDGAIVWRGKPLDALRCAYAPVIGMVEALLQELARQRGLYVTGEALADVQPADLLVIGSGGSAPADPAAKAKWLADWGGVAHGFMVTGVSGSTIISSDGGQFDPLSGHSTAIKRCERWLVKRANGWWLGARRLNWRMRCADLPLRRLSDICDGLWERGGYGKHRRRRRPVRGAEHPRASGRASRGGRG